MALSCLQRLEAEPTRARRVEANASIEIHFGSGLCAAPIRQFCDDALNLLERHFRRLVFLAVCFHFGLGGAGLRAEAPAQEIKTKAGMLKMFPEYVKWPSANGGEIKVGILGDDDLDGFVDSLNPRRATKIEDLKDCQMIFISKSEKENIPAILSALEGTNILTVGETESFAKQGGIIGFVKDDDKKTRFEINIGAARRAGLTFDLRLLRLVLHLLNN